MGFARSFLVVAFVAGCTNGGESGASDGGSDGSVGPPVESAVVLASGLRGAGAIAVRNGVVYWVDGDGSVMSVPAAGGAATTVGTGCQKSALAVDATNAYCGGI